MALQSRQRGDQRLRSDRRPINRPKRNLEERGLDLPCSTESRPILLVSIVTLLVWIFAGGREPALPLSFHFCGPVPFPMRRPTALSSRTLPGQAEQPLRCTSPAAPRDLSQAEGFAAASDKNPVKLSIGNPAIPATPERTWVELRDALRNAAVRGPRPFDRAASEPPSPCPHRQSWGPDRPHRGQGRLRLEGVLKPSPPPRKLYFPRSCLAGRILAPEVFPYAAGR